MARSCPVPRSPFASRSVTEHLARGLSALALVVVAFRFGDRAAYLLPVAVVGALVLMRGCPTCWVVGLVGTVADRTASRTEAPRPGRDRPHVAAE